jgi:hypothetical protein
LFADTTTRLQSAVDAAAKSGDSLLLKPGDYPISAPIVVPMTDGFSLEGTPGAKIVLSDPNAACGLDIINTKDQAAVRVIRNIQVVGSVQGDPTGVGKQVGIRLSNATVYAAYATVLDNVRVSYVSGAGIEITHAYGCDVRNAWVHHCGIGVNCDGANGAVFTVLHAKYNYIGAVDPQTVIGGRIEGNMADGIQIRDQNHRTNLSYLHFEQNGARVPGSADLMNIRADGRPVSCGLHGCNFTNTYDNKQRPFIAHNIRGLFNQLVLSGNTRFRHGEGPHYQFDIAGSVVRDSAGTNNMWDCPNGFDKSPGIVKYTRA